MISKLIKNRFILPHLCRFSRNRNSRIPKQVLKEDRNVQSKNSDNQNMNDSYFSPNELKDYTSALQKLIGLSVFSSSAQIYFGYQLLSNPHILQTLAYFSGIAMADNLLIGTFFLFNYSKITKTIFPIADQSPSLRYPTAISILLSLFVPGLLALGFEVHFTKLFCLMAIKFVNKRGRFRSPSDQHVSKGSSADRNFQYSVSSLPSPTAVVHSVNLLYIRIAQIAYNIGLLKEQLK